MLINYETDKAVQEVRERIEHNAKERGFGVLATHEVTNILKNKGTPIDYTSVIVEICQPSSAQQVLSKNPYIATALPCRVAIFEKGGKTVVSTIAPTEMIKMYDAPELGEVAQKVEELIKEIIEESVK
jgi:uncharacterized protein (DUF302 family)